MSQTPIQKNTVHGTVHANGNVHIGDIIYNIERDFKSGSILFLRLEHGEGAGYRANLSVKSKHADAKSPLATSGVTWCENMEVNIPPQLLEALNTFQTFRRGVESPMQGTDARHQNPSSVIALENHLGQLLFQTFFSGDIGQVCTKFIQLLEEQRIEELLLYSE